MPKRRSSITFPPPPCPPDPGPEPRPEPEPPSRPALFEPPLGFRATGTGALLGLVLVLVLVLLLGVGFAEGIVVVVVPSRRPVVSAAAAGTRPAAPPVFSKPRELRLAALPEHLVRRVRRRGVLELALDLAELGARRHEPRIGVLELLQLREQKLLSLCERRAERVVVRVVLAPAQALGGGASPVVVRVRLVVRVRSHRGGHRVAVAARDANRRGDGTLHRRRRLGALHRVKGRRRRRRIIGGSFVGTFVGTFV